MNWLARQPLARVVLIAAAWPILAPAALYLAAHLYIRWVIWRESGGRGGNFYWIGLDLDSPGAVVVLGLPPLALLVAWWLLRRAR